MKLKKLIKKIKKNSHQLKLTYQTRDSSHEIEITA